MIDIARLPDWIRNALAVLVAIITFIFLFITAPDWKSEWPLVVTGVLLGLLVGLNIRTIRSASIDGNIAYWSVDTTRYIRKMMKTSVGGIRDLHSGTFGETRRRLINGAIEIGIESLKWDFEPKTDVDEYWMPKIRESLESEEVKSRLEDLAKAITDHHEMTMLSWLYNKELFSDNAKCLAADTYYAIRHEMTKEIENEMEKMFASKQNLLGESES